MYKKDVYKDKKGEWRWRIIASNGKNIGSSNEGFKKESTAWENMKLVGNAIQTEIQQHDHILYALVGMMSFHLKSSPAFYRENAEKCIKYMEQNKLPLNFSTAENLFLERIRDYRKKLRKDIISPDELKKEKSEEDE